MKVYVDSEFQSLLPALKPHEYHRLERSILTDGYHPWEPIVTWNGTIIDGHNRYNICKEHGIEFTTQEVEFDSRDAAKIWVLEHQTSRRNLSEYDTIAYVSNALGELYAAEAKRKQVSSLKQGNEIPVSQKSDERETPIRTDERIADTASAMLGKKVSRDKVRKVQLIEAEAAKGNPTAIKAREDVRTGEKTINKAHESVRYNGNKSDQRPLCTVCGKPVDDNDHYPKDRNKHKTCANMIETESKRKNRKKPQKPQFTEDGRRICKFCGNPINDGEHFQDKLNWCKSCGRKHETEVQRKYRDADHDLRANVAAYTVDSLITELTSSVEMMRDTITESIAINKENGVCVSQRRVKAIARSIENVIKEIDKIRND